MLRVVCAVRDSAAGVFGQPFFVAAIGQATRSFSDEVNRAAADNVVYAHPDDFVLYELGIFDDESGLFSLPESGSIREVLRGKDAKQNLSKDAG